MNFLAHATLSPIDSPGILAGNIAADLLSPAEIRHLPESVKQGVDLHFTIDRLTDRHPAFRSGARRINKTRGKYGKVILDVFYDYLLAVNWDQVVECGMDEFIDRVYTQLESTLYLLPERVSIRVESMIRHNWLAQYGYPDKLSFTFRRLAERASAPAQFEGLHNYILQHEQEFTPEFFEVYNDVKNEVTISFTTE